MSRVSYSPVVLPESRVESSRVGRHGVLSESSQTEVRLQVDLESLVTTGDHPEVHIQDYIDEYSILLML
jgi:hypothetical protein